MASASGGSGGGILSKFLRINSKFPVNTAIGISAILWSIGDTVAQAIEHRGRPSQIDRPRLIGTTLEGSLVGGGSAVCGTDF